MLWFLLCQHLPSSNKARAIQMFIDSALLQTKLQTTAEALGPREDSPSKRPCLILSPEQLCKCSTISYQRTNRGNEAPPCICPSLGTSAVRRSSSNIPCSYSQIHSRFPRCFLHVSRHWPRPFSVLSILIVARLQNAILWTLMKMASATFLTLLGLPCHRTQSRTTLQAAAGDGASSVTPKERSTI